MVNLAYKKTDTQTDRHTDRQLYITDGSTTIGISICYQKSANDVDMFLP